MWFFFFFCIFSSPEASNIVEGVINGIKCQNKTINFTWNNHLTVEINNDDNECDWPIGRYFGDYNGTSSQFACIETPDSTTQWWVGNLIADNDYKMSHFNSHLCFTPWVKLS